MKGLTVMEMLVVMAVLGMVTAITIGGFLMFKRGSELDSASENLLSLLLEARSKTLSSKDSSSWGVRFETNRAILFKGTIFVDGAADNNVIAMPPSAEIATIALNGGGQNVVFKRLTGETDQYGALTLRLGYDASYTKTITILQTGIITAQ